MAWAAGVRASRPSKNGERLAHGQVEHLRDVQPGEFVVEHRGLETPALALLADRRDAGHHAQVGVDDPGAVARRAGALGVGAEEAGLTPLALAKALRIGFQQSV
jgi:hypothetical protein